MLDVLRELCPDRTYPDGVPGLVDNLAPIGPRDRAETLLKDMGRPGFVLHLVAQHCNQHTRCTLGATARLLHRICVEELFHTIDLSVHNSPELAHVGPVRAISWPHSRVEFEVPLDFSDRPRVPLDDEVWIRQKKLVRTVTENPEYGQYVRELHWSVLDPPYRTGNSIPSATSGRDEDGSSEDDELEQDRAFVRSPESWDDEGLRLLDHIGDDGPLWETFKAFTKVSAIDIAWLRSLRETCPPPPLFSTATSVRLAGQASKQFVSAILDSINPENLVSLATINLQEFADPLPPLPKNMPLREAAQFLENHSHIHDPTRTLSSTFAGPMHNHLAPLTSRCPKLAHLEIRSYAPWEHWEKISLDDARYAEWAAFIRSARPSLRTLVFEHHRAESSRLWRTNRSHPWGARGRPALWTLFNAHLLPVVTEAPWPRLERVELAGFHEITRCFACLSVPDFAQYEGPHLTFEVLDTGRGATNDTWAVRETHVALNAEERDAIEKHLGKGVELSIRGICAVRIEKTA
ncbi:hypothetical protein UCRNP2_4547 [Neofusicoccum parvum UCRNP2]|uniref:Uncharacterized protein n=1 Tax=Botryosphaeria parva (strain UCR-NP2) TaxID=1287680 RepID=R1GRQ5_BOTPV|nr:hypothetical protein UCRNP2_4547 [Neofusicoccum parvum UCRNP2]